METTIKKCTHCGNEKDAEKFSKDKRRVGGKASWCKECTNEASRNWQHKHKEHVAEVKHVWHEENREQYVARAKEWRLKNKEHRRLLKYAYNSKDPLFKTKEKARQTIRWVVAHGGITVPGCCSVCQKEAKLIGHHPNYDLPYIVAWVCRRCHGVIHKKALLKAIKAQAQQ